MDKQRAEGVNMGPPPTPTPIGGKRRNVSSIPRESQRPYFKQEPPKFTTLASAEQGVAAVSSQMQAQGRDSLLNRITIPLKEKAVIGPDLGTFPPDERARAIFITRDMVKEKERRDMMLRQQLHEAKEREAKEQWMREQDIRIRPQQESE